MNRWCETTLGHVIQLQRGHDLPERDRRAGSVPVIGSAGPNGWHDIARAPGPGVTIGRSGASAGAVTFVPKPYWPHNTVLFVKDFKGNDPRFVAYLLSTLPLAQLNSGAAQPSLNRNFLYPLPVRIPSPRMQGQIASLLGAYDDLIEVNRRRIGLIDEMARRIFADAVENYRESGRQGTSVSTVIASTLGGDWGSETSTPEEPCEVRVIRGTDFRRIQSGDFSTAPQRYISETSLKRRSLGPYDIVVENSINAKTRNAGTPLLVSAGIIKAFGGATIATSFCRLFRCATPESAVVLFYALDRMQRNNEMQQFQVVAANGIANFQSEQFLKRAVVPLAADIIEPLGRQLIPLSATTFQQQNSVLSQQRNLLLPRLVSGELTLSAAERELEAVA